ncbi:MAG: sphingosine kinase [Polyangiaceae bacterium]|nr:sphingosine kinase [Polyangiaceae bacterium]
MSGIGVVLNPKSRHNLRNPGAAARLAARLGDHGVVREARSIDELYRIAEDFRRDAVEILAINGGDGTNTVTLSGFFDVYGGAPLPEIALLRGGTMNTVANSIGVHRGRPEALLERLVHAYARRNGAPLHRAARRVMRVATLDSTGAETKPPQYGFLFGTGVMHGFLAEYYGAGDPPSVFVAASTLLRGSASALVGGPMIRRMAAPFRGSVTLADGTTWEARDYLAVAAGTIAHIGLDFKPFHRFAEAKNGTAAFHALGIYASPLAFVAELPRIHQGRAMHDGKAFEALSTGMVLRSTEGVVRYMVDGDLHISRHPIEVTIGPGVWLIVT